MGSCNRGKSGYHLLMLPWMSLFIRYLLVIKVIIPATAIHREDTRQLVISPSIIEVRLREISLTQHSLL